MKKLAIITSHPIQYYAPWFQYLASRADFAIKVFYLWDFGVTEQVDAGFQQSLQWDIPLLTGYDYEFVPNISLQPGTHHFWGLQNPSLLSRVKAYNSDAVLLMSYNYTSLYRFLLSWNVQEVPLLFRGDSHRLLPSTGFKAWLHRQFISLIYCRFAACLYVGKANYNYFRYHRVPTNNLFFSPHTVDNDRFFAQSQNASQQAIAWKKELNIPDEDAVILFVGKFELKKRPLDLLEAFLKAQLTRVSLLFVGSGPLEQDLKSKATEYQNIYFASFQNQTLIPRTYAVADLVVLPSYGSYETWGLVINEAMCLARPIIASTHVGCTQDLVYHHHNGLIFPAGDVSALTHSLQEAFSDRQRLQRWGENSRNIISQYSYAEATRGLSQALNHITSGVSRSEGIYRQV